MLRQLLKSKICSVKILQGYTSDPWFADASNTAELELRHGLYCKGDALVVSALPDLEVKILKELHDSNYARHVGYYMTTHMVRRMYWCPAMAKEIREYVCFACQQNKPVQTHPAGKLVPMPILNMLGNMLQWTALWDYLRQRMVTLPY